MHFILAVYYGALFVAFAAAAQDPSTLKLKPNPPRLLQRLKIPRPDQDRALAAGVINPCADLVDALGSATVLCFADVDGIVCEPLMSPKQVLLVSHKQALFSHIKQVIVALKQALLRCRQPGNG